MNFPSNLKYTKDHEWILVEGDQATVGITDFAQSELGDLVFIDISTEENPFLMVKCLVQLKQLKL